MFSRRALGLALCFLLATPHLGFSQEEKTNERSMRLEGITVTATKQEEDVQKIPTSVSAFTDVQLEDAKVDFVQDLAKRVPNLGFYTGGMNLINFPTLRGIRSDPHNNVSSVAMYVDDVPVTSNLGFVSDMYDIERVEVLRGPQGTLYGRSSEGGVINIITKRPDNTPRGSGTLEVGSGYMYHLKGNLAGPLIEDKLYIGIAGNTYKRDGWVKNDFDDDYVDDKKNYSGRGKIRFTPTDDLDITFFASYLKYDEGSFSMYKWPTDDERHVNTDTPGYNRSSIDDQALHIKYDINKNWSITSVSARRYTDADYMVDYDFSPMKFGETHKYDKYNDLSQEIRLGYTNDGVNFLLGGYYDRFDRRVQYEAIPFKMVTETQDVTDTRSLFAHLKYPIWGGLSVSGGLRYDSYTSDFDSQTFSDEKDWSSFSPKIALEYAFNDNSMIYASVARGYRAGGFNSYTPPAGKNSFDEEELWAYEIGSKNMLFDNTLKVNLAFFVNDIKDVQVEQYVPTAMNPMPYIDNSGDTRAWGAETEISWMPLDGLKLFASAGYTHMRYGEFEDANGDHEGNRLPYVPDYTYNVGAQYRHSSGFFARGEVLGSSKVYLDSENEHSIPTHATVNGKIGWEFENADVYLFATNLFDKEYDFKGAFGGGYAVASQPRAVGLCLTYHFL